MILRKVVGMTKSDVPCQRRPIYNYSFDNGITWVDSEEYFRRIMVVDQNDGACYIND